MRLRSTEQNGEYIEQTFQIDVEYITSNELPTDIQFIRISGDFEENVRSYIVGSFTKIGYNSINVDDTIAYRLIKGKGDADNSLFQIINNK